MFDMLLKQLLPPGVTPETLMGGVNIALEQVRQVQIDVAAIKAGQERLEGMLAQIITDSQASQPIPGEIDHGHTGNNTAASGISNSASTGNAGSATDFDIGKLVG